MRSKHEQGGARKSKEEQEFSDFMAAAEAKTAAEAEVDDKKPLTEEESAKVIEVTIRKAVNKPTGELTKADLEKVTKLNFGGKNLTDVKGLEKLTHLKRLFLSGNRLTDVKGLEKLNQLTKLGLSENPALTKAQIAQLQKSLPECNIFHTATK